jgi:hypothetical protein
MTFCDGWGFLYHPGVVSVSANKIMSRKETSVQAYSQVNVTIFVPAPDDHERISKAKAWRMASNMRGGKGTYCESSRY